MNLGVEIVVAGIDDPASPYGHAIAMLRTEARRNQFMISFHAEHIVNLHTKLPLRNLLRAVIVEVRIRQRRGEILIAVVWGDVEFPIGSERVEKHIVIGRQTISI